MNRMKLSFVALGIAAMAGTASAQTWNEIGDAGDYPTNPAQVTVGVGALTSINGFLAGASAGDDADAYLLTITDAANFMASTDPNYGGSFIDVGGFQDDSRLWLYDAMTGSLLMANDDDGTNTGSNSLESTLLQPAAYQADGGTLLNNPVPVTNGQMVILVVGEYDTDFVDGAGEGVADLGSPFDQLSGPNPAYAGGGSYQRVFAAEDIDYTIALRGASFKVVPAPASLALLGLGGLAIRRRR